MDKRFLEDCLAKGMSLPQIGKLAGKPAGTVGYWVKKYGLTANGAQRFSPQTGISEALLELAVEEELTLQEMSWEFERSISTVRYWLKKYGFPTSSRRRRRQKKFTDPPGTRKQMECRHHGQTEFVVEGRGYYRCVRCRSEAVARRRRAVKKILVEEAGGACIMCGYAGCPSALEFHHLDPSRKSFHLSVRGRTSGIAKLRAEAQKCVLLCARCHAEVEAGDRVLPIKSVSAASNPKQIGLARCVNPG
jgi:hypothetical protein